PNQLPNKLGQQFVGQELTIDTSQGFLTYTPSLSPCTSRFSTRSSTLPSLSSPSPTGSDGFQSRSLSHHHSGKASGSNSHSLSLACPVHSMLATNAASERISCAECQLLEQSAASVSPGSLRCGRFHLRSLSSQQTARDSSFLSERRLSSAEPSPNFKLTPVFERSPNCSLRKRKKSSNLSGDESDSSPPRLEKNVCISPRTNHDINFFSEPPNITNSEKSHVSPKQTSSSKSSVSTKPFLSSPASKKKVRRIFSPKKKVSPKKAQPPKKKTLTKPPPKKKCNNDLSSNFIKKSSRSVITMSCPEHEPLPLEHCSNRKLVKEIKAAISLKSSKQSDCEEESGPEDTILPSPLQPPRKRYQRVGLFSDFYKDSEPRKRCENMVRCRDRLTYIPGEHEFGLLPQPLHIGHFYMRQEQDFQLPYDIWWQHIHHQLPKKPEPKIKFRNIRTNVYSDAKVNHRKLEIPLCNCKAPENGGPGCQDDCLNRMIYTECSPSTCPLGENCSNQRIQKHEWAPGLVKVQTKDRGIGVVTKNSIKSGQFILEYLGEVVSETEFRRRMMEEYSEECHHYALHLDSGSLIDGYRMGNIGRYVNHSCQPNCEMQKWNVNGLYRMVLFALRDIEAGEELGYDYNFDPFNQETQQECRCGSAECRGVIGGKRSLGTCKQMDKVEEDYKDKRKSKCMNKKIKDKLSDSLPVQPMTKPMTLKERCYARKHRTFLVRNVDKIRNQRNHGDVLFPAPKEELNTLDCTKINAFNSDLMLATLNERSVKTRLAAYAKDNPELGRRHQLAQIFDKMLTDLLSLKDKDGFSVVTPLMSLPSRKKQPQYYTIVRDPIDMSIIKQRVKTGFYDHLSSFNADVMLLFSNVELYCGPKSDLGQVIFELRHVFNCVKTDVASQIDEILGPNTTKSHMDLELARLEQAHNKATDEPEEDIIRCICGVTRDEGLMLMCEKCSRWQHCDCVQASGTEEHYLCDRCEPRHYDPEILLIPPPPDAMPDCTHYMTLVKDEVQYAVGDCVYVMRDCKRTSSGAPLRTSHRLLATSSPDKLDVFRIDQLWKDPKGERFASGTPYLRPQETFHEPTRKFYINELFRTPSFEIIPLELVMGKCVVMDPNTYSKGRPKGFKEQDIYICEYRVDKTAHLFHKIQKIWYPINTSKFCFDWYDRKLNLKRTFSPHEVPEEYKRKAAIPTKKEEKEGTKKVEKTETNEAMKSKHGLGHSKLKVDESIKNDLKLKAEVKVNVKKGSCNKKEVAQMLAESNADQAEKNKIKRQERKVRLDKILNRLLNNIPGKQKVDLTYLLEDEKRIRKKITK
ncbi:histone-lysine N-methyltransferase, partial [Plakobranchus ocellatus]